MKNHIKTICLSLIALMALGCAPDLMTKDNLAPGTTVESSEDLMGSGKYSSNALNQIDTSNIDSIDNMTDEELLANHISMLKRLLENLTAEEGIELPEEIENAKERLIEDLKKRIDRLETDEDFAEQVVERIRAMIEKIKEMRESGELPEPRAAPTNCQFLKKVLDSGRLPEEIQAKEQERYEKQCSE